MQKMVEEFGVTYLGKNKLISKDETELYKEAIKNRV